MDYGKSLKAARKWAGLTQEALASRAEVATITIRQYEAGKRKPSTENWFAIAKALNLSIDELNNAELLPSDRSGLPLKVDASKTISAIDAALREMCPDLYDYEQEPGYKALVRIDEALTKLNDKGVSEAVKRVEELTKIPDYQRAEDLPDTP